MENPLQTQTKINLATCEHSIHMQPRKLKDISLIVIWGTKANLDSKAETQIEKGKFDIPWAFSLDYEVKCLTSFF